jgi:hypothetical protein
MIFHPSPATLQGRTQIPFARLCLCAGRRNMLVEITATASLSCRRYDICIMDIKDIFCYFLNKSLITNLIFFLKLFWVFVK